jgi:divalent metal cation (Fe/Co/Zn/Cd) transporter
MTPVASDLTGRALALARLTVGWNVVEGAVSIAFGIQEGSVALLGFGVDAWVEVASAGVVLWKLTRAPGCATERRAQERRATRWIGVLFLLLGLTTALGAVLQLRSGGHPDSSVPAVLISVVSIILMAWLWRAKAQLAEVLDSPTLRMDAACSRACLELSGVLLVGAALYVAVPALWWVDAAAALVLAGFIAREGVEGIRAASRPDFAGGCGCG